MTERDTAQRMNKLEDVIRQLSRRVGELEQRLSWLKQRRRDDAPEAEAASLMRAIAPVLHDHIKAATEPRNRELAEIIIQLTRRVAVLEARLRDGNHS
jgi:hypothetical protein